MFKLPDLPYDYDALEPHIDARTMEIHHSKHHQTYVDKLNKALEGQGDLLDLSIYELMTKLDKVSSDAKRAVRNNGGGHANHSFFWEVMAPGAGGEPEGKLAEALSKEFGSFASFKQKFSDAAVNVFGSGWVWLIVDGDKLAITATPLQDNPWMEGLTPILGLDVWEHAYYLKHQNKRPDYIEAWWNVVNWEEVAKRFSTGR